MIFYTSSMTEAEKQEIKGQFKNSLSGKKLKEFLQRELDNLLATERTLAQFEDRNWTYKQSFNNGRAKVLSDLLKILGE